jgi:excisionase family DNA binding protein
MSEIAIITVSAQEWNETKDMIKSISEKLSMIIEPGTKELLTVNEVCKILKCGRSTFERLKGKGAFPIQRTSGTSKVWVKRLDLEKAISSGLI